ncbi:hypothetical protein H0H87_009014, partial [Tephrocybe sp. NHM501043]
MDSSLLPVVLAFPCCLLAVRAYRRWSTEGQLPLPPSPPSDPFIGHLRYGLAADPHVSFYELGKKYGDIIHLNTFGRVTIIVNSVQRAFDLLDKRSANYSDRFIPRALNDKIATTKYLPVQLREARIFVQKLAQGPNIPEMETIISTFVTTIIVRIVSGYQIISPHDPYIKLAREVSAALAQGGSPGGSLLDFFPF